jgi:hypothetical protein
MRAEACRALRKNGRAIANALARNAVEGNVPSLKLLYDWAKDDEKGGGANEEAAVLRSRAMELAAEPEWNAILPSEGPDQNDGLEAGQRQ